MFGKIGFAEIAIVIGVALLIFGPSKIGDLGKSLGDGIRNFKSAVKDEPHHAAAPEKPQP